MDPPHIWSWHRRHDRVATHPRSLASAQTMDDFDASPEADPHDNGTIWAAALWDLRSRLGNPIAADLLVLSTLQLLRADGILFASSHVAEIRDVFELRRIRPAVEAPARSASEGLEDAGSHRTMVLN